MALTPSGIGPVMVTANSTVLVVPAEIVPTDRPPLGESASSGLVEKGELSSACATESSSVEPALYEVRFGVSSVRSTDPTSTIPRLVMVIVYVISSPTSPRPSPSGSTLSTDDFVIWIKGNGSTVVPMSRAGDPGVYSGRWPHAADSTDPSSV